MNMFKFTAITFFTKRKNIILILTSIAVLIIFFVFNIAMLEKEDLEKEAFLKNDPNMLDFYFDDTPFKSLDSFIDDVTFDSDYERRQISNFHTKRIKYYEFLTTNDIRALTIENEFLNDYPLINQEIITDNNQITRISKEYLINKQKINNYLISSQYTEESTRYGKNASMFTNATIQIICSMYGIFLLLFIFGSGISEDFYSKNIKFVITQPSNRIRYLVSNVFFTFFCSMILILVLLILSFSLGLIFFGIGNINYPIYINSPANDTFLPIWKYWIQLLGAFCPVFLYYIVFHFLLSILTENHYLSIFISFIVNTFFHSIFTIKPLTSLDFLNPFIYLNPINLFVGLDFKDIEFFSESYGDNNTFLDYKIFMQDTNYFEGKNISTILSNGHVSIFYCFLSLLLLSFLLCCISNIMINKKNI